MVTHHSKYGHSFSKEWSPTIPRMVIHHPQEGHPPIPGRLPTIIRSAAHCPKDIWLHNMPMMVTQHHPRDCFHFFQHSVALPAKLVLFFISSYISIKQSHSQCYEDVQPELLDNRVHELPDDLLLAARQTGLGQLLHTVINIGQWSDLLRAAALLSVPAPLGRQLTLVVTIFRHQFLFTPHLSLSYRMVA